MNTYFWWFSHQVKFAIRLNPYEFGTETTKILCTKFFENNMLKIELIWYIYSPTVCKNKALTLIDPN